MTATTYWRSRNAPTPVIDPDCECCSGSGTDPAFLTECTECWGTPTARSTDPIAIHAAIEALPAKDRELARLTRSVLEQLWAWIDYPVTERDHAKRDSRIAQLERLMNKPTYQKWAGDR